MSSTPRSPDLHQSLISQLALITSMERGTLAEEFRPAPSPDGKGTVLRGPYFKHQCWEDGRNRSCRVRPEQVTTLREDLRNAERFDRIIGQLAALAVAQSRSRRATSGEAYAQADAKKNSKSNASKSATAKPRRSSPPSRPALRKKA